jgi:hypothetical protein
MKTVKVKPWGEGQGDHVLINEADLTDEHVLFGKTVKEDKFEPKAADKPQIKPQASA